MYFREKLTFIRTRYRQNQRLWRHFGDKMSLENRGVFQLLNEVTLRRILVFFTARGKLTPYTDVHSITAT